MEMEIGWQRRRERRTERNTELNQARERESNSDSEGRVKRSQQ